MFESQKVKKCHNFPLQKMTEEKPKIVRNERKEQLNVGIDLGTTNTVFAYASIKSESDIQYEIIENKDGETLTPSIVVVQDDCEIVGTQAKNILPRNIGNTITNSKRLLGKTYDEVEDFLKDAPFTPVPDEKGMVKCQVKTASYLRTFYPYEISSLILRYVKESINIKYKKDPDNVVITVPAYFNSAQRDLTMKAAKEAGLNCIHLLSEPVAAAISLHTSLNDTHGNVLVFDFGGGTIDVSVVNIDGETNSYFVKGVSGLDVGGADLDKALARELFDQFIKQNKEKLKSAQFITEYEKQKIMADLQIDAEKAKLALSSPGLQTYNVVHTALYKGCDLNYQLTQEALEFITDDSLSQVTDPIDALLEDLELPKSDITNIILVGGSSKIPKVQELLQEMFEGIAQISVDDPAFAVAKGAAIFCDKTVNNQTITFSDKEITRGDALKGAIKVVHCLPISIGVLEKKTKFIEYFKKSTPLPCIKTLPFTTERVGSKLAVIQILQGDEEVVDLKDHTHTLLNTIKLEGLAKREIIYIEMRVDEDGILHVSAVADKTRKASGVTISILSGYTNSFYQEQYMEKLSTIKNKIDKLSKDGKNVDEFIEQYKSFDEKVLIDETEAMYLIPELDKLISELKKC